MSVTDADVQKAKDSMIFDLTNNLLQARAFIEAMKREAEVKDENHSNGEALPVASGSEE